MSKSFFEALAAMHKEHLAESHNSEISLQRIYTDVAELAARMGVEANATKSVVEMIFDAEDAQRWDGQGLPPVGCVCEVINHVTGSWRTAFIAAHHVNGEEALWTREREGGQVMYGGTEDFRPLRTDRDRAIDEMMKVAPSSECVDEALFKPRMTKSEREFAGSIYDAGMYKQESES